jgi:hypothetical protein
MKISKILLAIISILVIPLLTFLFFLYRQDRLIILYKKNHEKKNSVLSSYEERLSGILITEKEVKKIPFSITFDTFDKNNPEEFIYAVLYQFFHYINLEYIGKMNYDLYHVAINNKSIIINGSLNQIELLSPYAEYILLKSIFLTIKNIFPFIESIYFYNDELPLKLNYILPFFTKEMILEEPSNIHNELETNRDLIPYELFFIPFFQGNGNKIEDIFEKNLFQKNESTFFIPKNKHNTDEYFKEINQYKVEIPNKIIFYITIKHGEKEHLDIVYYAVIPEEEIAYQVDLYPSLQKNTILDSIIHQLKKSFNSISLYAYPFIPLINTVYPSLYITISIKNKNELIPTLEKIKKINLYT